MICPEHIVVYPSVEYSNNNGADVSPCRLTMPSYPQSPVHIVFLSSWIECPRKAISRQHILLLLLLLFLYRNTIGPTQFIYHKTHKSLSLQNCLDEIFIYQVYTYVALFIESVPCFRSIFVYHCPITYCHNVAL